MTPNDLENLPWPVPSAPTPALSEAIRHNCTDHLTPKKPLDLRKRVLLSIGISGALFAVLLSIGWMRHPPEEAILMALVGAIAWGFIQACVLFVSHGRPPGLRGARWLRWMTALLIPAIFFTHLHVSSNAWLSFEQFLSVPHSLRSTVVCGIHAILFGTIASIVLFVLWRRTDPFSPRLTGALTGLAGGLVGAVALDMTCTRMEAWHLWLGHGVTLVALVAGGWFAGRKWLSP